MRWTLAAGSAAGGVPADGASLSGPAWPKMSAARLAGLVSAEAVDRMLADADAAGVPAERLLSELTKTVLERALGAELDDHLGYVKGDPAGTGRGIPVTAVMPRRSPRRPGPCELAVPRDRASSFEPVIVPKRQPAPRADR